MSGSDSKDLVALRRAWEAGDPDAYRQLNEIAQRVASKIVWRYPLVEYGFIHDSNADVAGEFAGWLLVERLRNRVTRLLARATDLEGVEQGLPAFVRQWLIGRYRQTKAGKLLRRVRHLASPSSKAAFEWVVRLRWMTWTDGPRDLREGDRVALARDASGAPEVRELVAASRQSDKLPMRTFRAATRAIAESHGAAIRDLLLTDALMELANPYETRPRVVRDSVVEPPWLGDPETHEAAVSLHEGLMRRLGVTTDELDERYGLVLESEQRDELLASAIGAELDALELSTEQVARTLKAFDYVLDAHRPSREDEDEADGHGHGDGLSAEMG